MILIAKLLELYSIIIIIRAILSWFITDPDNNFYQLLLRITEPVLKPIRDLLPMMSIDLSPLIVLIIIQFLINFFR